jgi:hypothetical protein
MKSSSWRRSWTWPSATIWCVANASRSAAVASAGVGAARAGVAVAIAAMVATSEQGEHVAAGVELHG